MPSKRVEYMVGQEKHNFFHFFSKNLKATEDSLYQLKLFVFDRDSYF